MKSTFRIALIVAAYLVAVNSLYAAAPTTKPNIIMVLFDDLGYGEPTCYRADSPFKTPNIDRVAQAGMRFTDAHSASGVCTPTRYGLLTGRYPFRIGQYGVLTSFSPPIIPEQRLTVPAFLKQQGYTTACIGKWHLGMNWPGKFSEKENVPLGTEIKTSPNAAGFDYFFGYTHARNIGTVIEQNKVVKHVQEVAAQPLQAEKIVSYLNDPARHKQPFFLYLPLCPPHTPIVPAAEFAGKSGVSGKESEYGDWMYQGDWVLGQVLDALDRQQLAENTLLIVSSDNGAAGRSYQPLRASKASIYEGGHRVPFLARWPGKIQPASTCNQTICLNDLLATCAELLNQKLPPEAGEDSCSLLPALLGNAKTPVREATVHQSHAGDLAIRQGPWKLIFLKSGKRELYHLENDLSETQDLLTKHPDVQQKLTALMQRYIDQGRSTPGPVQQNNLNVSLDKPVVTGKKQKME